MAHRNVHFFRKQPTIIYNQINNYNVHNCGSKFMGGYMSGCCGGSVWANPMMLMQMLYASKSIVGGLFGGYGNDYASFNRYTQPWAMQQNTATTLANTNNQNSTLKNLETIYKDVTWIYQDGEFWGAKDGAIVARGKTFDEANAAMQKYLGKDTNVKTDTDIDTDTEISTDTEVNTDTDVDTDTEINTDTDIDTDIDTNLKKKEVTDADTDTDNDTYRIDENTKNQITYTIKKGNTWWGIVSANYDTSNLSGKQIIELALRLSAANSGIEDPEEAYKAAQQGIYFKVGDEINLPQSLKVGGKDIPRNDTIKDAATQKYKFASGGRMVATISSTSETTYELYINGELHNTYKSREEAEKNIPKGAVLETK